jgi:hypothetical protein
VYINLPEHHRHYSKDEAIPAAAAEADEEEEGVKLMRGCGSPADVLACAAQ